MSKYTNAKYPDKINDLVDNNGNINPSVVSGGTQLYKHTFNGEGCSARFISTSSDPISSLKLPWLVTGTDPDLVSIIYLCLNINDIPYVLLQGQWYHNGSFLALRIDTSAWELVTPQFSYNGTDTVVEL